MAKLTLPALLSAAAIGKQIDRVGKSVLELKDLLHTTAIQCLMHAQAHGDVTLMKRLFDSLDHQETQNSMVRAEAMRVWVGAMSPITSRNDVWSLKKGWNKEDFLIQDALDTPFWMFSRERDPVTVSFDSLMNRLKGLIKMVDKAVDEDRFAGDATAVKETLTNVVDFAEKQAAKLTATQKGEVDETAAIVKKAATGGSQSKEVAA